MLIIHQHVPENHERGIIGTVIAFTLPGGLSIVSFSLSLGIGAVIGLAWIAVRGKPKEIPVHLDAGLAAVLGGLVGGRIAYGIVHFAYFRDHLVDLILLPLGGLSWPGAVIGVVLALWVVALLRKQSVLALVDALLPMATTVAISAWLACWLGGFAYGQTLDAWWAIPSRDEWGVMAARLPVQLLGAILTLGLLWLVEWRQPSKAVAGQMALRWALGFSLIMLFLTWLRADPAPLWLGLRLDAWAAILFLGFSTAGLYFFETRIKDFVEKEI